ncbi:hypothetical protein F5B21DRAFT_502923 [Xylaria acuta]|nr:hypothetical protein F5B21DRAFT_502923 [Xylaria acuta]
MTAAHRHSLKNIAWCPAHCLIVMGLVENVHTGWQPVIPLHCLLFFQTPRVASYYHRLPQNHDIHKATPFSTKMASPGSSPSPPPSLPLRPINGTAATQLPEANTTTKPPNKDGPDPAKDGDNSGKKPDDQDQGKGQKQEKNKS